MPPAPAHRPCRQCQPHAASASRPAHASSTARASRTAHAAGASRPAHAATTAFAGRTAIAAGTTFTDRTAIRCITTVHGHRRDQDEPQTTFRHDAEHTRRRTEVQ